MSFLHYADGAKPGEQQKWPASSPADKLDVNRKYDHEQHESKFLPHWAKDCLRIEKMKNILYSVDGTCSITSLHMYSLWYNVVVIFISGIV